jgi:uncharacterized protein (DUF305 family)
VSRRLAALAIVVALAACSGGADGASPVDVGFLQDMADHHEQAVRMALLITGKYDVSPITRSFAVDVIASQRYELGLIDAYLEDADEARGRPDRDVMAWMDMATSLATMPGMATQAQLDALAAATGADADRQFFDLMVEHHRGGLHMAEYERDNGDDDGVVALAKRILFAQNKEIREMELATAQLESSRLPSQP